MSAIFAGRLSAAADRARTYDRVLIVIAGMLLLLGILFSMAASPAATARINLEEAFYFAARQAAYALAGAVVIFAAAALEPRGARRLAVILTAIMLPLCVLAGVIAPEVKGASRWIDFGFVSLQPSEILKPALVVVWAWMLSESMRRPEFPGRRIAIALYALAAAALLTQPDIGQIALLGLVLGPMLMLSGMSIRWLAGGVAAAIAGGFAVYNLFPHARVRVDAFLGEPGYQVGRALDAIAAGGVFGRGPGEGVIKRSLPDAHADFVYAVAAEEFGLLASLGLIAIFGALAFRGLSRSARLTDPFAQVAAAGLVTLLVAQASIHIAVNLSLIPAKGMTLPFISFGGSSMIGSALAFGFCLALLRNRPGAYLYSGRV